MLAVSEICHDAVQTWLGRAPADWSTLTLEGAQEWAPVTASAARIAIKQVDDPGVTRMSATAIGEAALAEYADTWIAKYPWRDENLLAESVRDWVGMFALAAQVVYVGAVLEKDQLWESRNRLSNDIVAVLGTAERGSVYVSARHTEYPLRLTIAQFAHRYRFVFDTARALEEASA